MILFNISACGSLRSRFNPAQGQQLNDATIAAWTKVQKLLIPTPSRFHYVFNMRDLSRIFQGIMEAPAVIATNEVCFAGLWKHECTRVFADKLARKQDKQIVDRIIADCMLDHFSETLATACADAQWWCDFQSDKVNGREEYDDGEIPRVYEPVKSWNHAQKKAQEYLCLFNERNPAKAMNLVLFDDAMMHLMRISRVIRMKRGSIMLVGVGGSGKQSLTRLAAFIAGHMLFQINITKTYNDVSFMEDLKALCLRAGQKGEAITFIFTDTDIKNDGFLEYMNSILATGEVLGLLQKDERDAVCGEVRNTFVRDRQGQEDNLINLYDYFLSRVRDNLHFALCFSPLHPRFPLRAQMFPAVFSAVYINWFLPWPEEALVAVSASFLGSFEVDTSQENRSRLYDLMGSFQRTVHEVCNMYLLRMRRHVYVTPKSYLSLVEYYMKLYRVKFEELTVQEKSVNKGLQRLADAALYVERMQSAIIDREAELRVEDDKTNQLLMKVQSEKAKAEKKADEVGIQKRECEQKANAIQCDKEEANVQLNNALPFLHDATTACQSIRDKDIIELKQTTKPVDIVRLTFDGILILRSFRVVEVRQEDKLINRITSSFIHDSFDEYGKSMLADFNFLKHLKQFAENDRDIINDETCELLQPYLRCDSNSVRNWSPWKHAVLDQALAKKANSAAEGLCKFVGAMVMYHEASKIVRPRMEFLKLQEIKLEKAKQELTAAEAELQRVQGEVDDLAQQLEEAIGKKTALETDALAMRRRMDSATRLLNGLSMENERWTQDAKLRHKASATRGRRGIGLRLHHVLWPLQL